MDFKFRTLTLKSGKKQLLVDFSPKSDILSSFVESEVSVFGQEVLDSIQEAIEKEEAVEFAGNSCIATFEKEYSKVESQFEDTYCILKTEELVRIIEAFVEEKSKL